jgi:SPP1 gp7 family putative phage head morphogenesis protein
LVAKSSDPFKKSRWLAEHYARQLKQVAREVGRIVNTFDPLNTNGLAATKTALEAYAKTLGPWSFKVAVDLSEKLDAQDKAMWRKNGMKISNGLRNVVLNTPVGAATREFQARQVDMITSLPREAATRVHELAMEARISGNRSTTIIEEIMASGPVTESRAKLIARTEVARAGSILTQERAKSIGATQYIWRTSRDEGVRESHREMEGMVCEIDHPPLLSDGTRTAPGQIYNCRCTAEIILPEL